RHTRWPRDWSSDVCSSDLVDRHWFRVVSTLTVASLIVGILEWAPLTLIEIPFTMSTAARGQIGLAPTEAAIVNAVGVALRVLFRSEERRVGKEGGSRGARR